MQIIKQILLEVILTAYAKKTDVATDITAIKNDYVTNASLTSQLNDLRSQHIATEVTSIDNKTKKNASDILALENKLTQKEDTMNENERGLTFNRGFIFYMDQSYLVYDCRMGSFSFGFKDISAWKSTGIYNSSSRSNMNALANSKNDLPSLKNDGRMHVYLSGNHFQQNKVIIPNNNNAISIYCVYKLDPIASNRDTNYKTMFSTKIKNPLFTYYSRFVNILDFNPKKLSIEKVCAINDKLERIYYVKYDKDPFYLIIDDLKGYFKYSKEKDTAELSSLERRKELEFIIEDQRKKEFIIKYGIK